MVVDEASVETINGMVKSGYVKMGGLANFCFVSQRNIGTAHSTYIFVHFYEAAYEGVQQYWHNYQETAVIISQSQKLFEVFSICRSWEVRNSCCL